LLIARWTTLRRTLDAFGCAEIALAFTILLSMFTYELLPYWFTHISMLLARRADAYPLYESVQAFICFAVMFIPAVCLGTTLPLASRIATAELARTGRSVGKIFAVNTVGTVLGAIVTGLWLMPSLGLPATFAIGIVLNFAVGAAILFRARVVRLQPALIGSVAAAALVFIWIANGIFELPWQRAFVQGIWRRHDPLASIRDFRNNGAALRIDYYKDGAGSTVSVNHPANVPRYIVLRVNGKVDASSGDEGTQLMLGHVPCLLNTKATNALVVGLGSGMTSGAILRHTNILGVQAVEISPEVVQAAHLFTNVNDNVFANPRFHVAIEDAKSFLQTTTQKYDLIVSEPSNPWMAGVAAVFSLEYYQSCAERLAKGGTMAQWVQVYETSDRTFQTVVKTFSAVFPFVSIWRGQSGDVILVGNTEPTHVDIDAFVQRMRVHRIGRDLARGGCSEPLALLAREVVSPSNGAFIAQPDDIVHSDYYPVLDYMAQVGFFVGENTGIPDKYDETKSPRAETLLGQYLREHTITQEDFKLAAQAAVDNQFLDPALTYSLMQRWALTETNSTLPFEMLERLLPTRGSAISEELRLLPRHAWLIEHGKTDVAALHFYERVLMRAYRAKRSVFFVPDTGPLQETLAILLDRDPKNHRVFELHLAELAWDRGDDSVALRFGLAGLEPDTKKAGPFVFTLDELAPRQVLTDLIETSLRTGQTKQAQAFSDLAKFGKLLRPGELFFPPLDLACRKAAAATEAASTSSAK
jgi:spermidine synthase